MRGSLRLETKEGVYYSHMQISQILIGINIVSALVVLLFVQRLLKAASKYAWNPGDNEVQLAQRIIILKSIVVIVCISIIAAIINVSLG